MGGHGGLNILPQKSWNVYGQRNRQKVAEDEAAEREKQAKEREQQTRGDRVARVNVLRNQRPSQVDEPSHQDIISAGDTQDRPQQPLRHINFWSDHEAATRNPEAEAEKVAQLRKRGDPKTQTSDARFDERFAVLHGHTGQAPWYARRTTALYSEDTAGIDHSRSCALASVRSLLDKSQPPRLLQPQPSRRGRGRHSHPGSLEQPHGSSRNAHTSHSVDGTTVPSARPRRSGHDAADAAPVSPKADEQPDAATIPLAPARTVPSRSRSRSPHERISRRSGKHKRDKKYKKHKHRSRERSHARSRSGSPDEARVSRSHSRRSHRRRHRSPSGSTSSDDGGGGGSEAMASHGVTARKSADGFEALRKERLERERLEAARSKQLLKEHFSRR